jgi:hypothetical protein
MRAPEIDVEYELDDIQDEPTGVFTRSDPDTTRSYRLVELLKLRCQGWHVGGL